ncbi:MAG: hypothetical protein JSS74_02455 [Actinobacteria bacterium]|nr:hypothetical protein [Actinomycetota bacterium]
MTAQTIATAEAALAALTGNVTHRPTDHEIALAEALQALVSDHTALLREGHCAKAWDEGVEAALYAVTSPEPGAPFSVGPNPYEPAS